MGDGLRVAAFCAASDIAGTFASVPDTVATFAKNMGLTNADISVGDWADKKLSQAFGVSAELREKEDAACLAGEAVSMGAQFFVGGALLKTTLKAGKAVLLGSDLTNAQRAGTALTTTMGGIAITNAYYDRESILNSLKNTGNNLGL
jgi:hypothetical protein